MRYLLFFWISAAAFAQEPLIGLNSTAAKVPAGARDATASITLDPSLSGGDLLAVMATSDGIGIRIELPGGRIVTKENASSFGFTWDTAGQGQGDALLFPGLQGKVNQLLVLPPKAPAGKYRIHADARGVQQDSALLVEFLPLGALQPNAGAQRDTIRVALTSPEMFHHAGDKVQLVAGVFDGNRGVANARLDAQAVAVDQDDVPLGRPMPVKFRPSGPGADGSYVAELPTSAIGKYVVALTVRGKYPDGTPFERIASTSIDIEPRRADVLSLTETPVDQDGNGLIDRIDITARIHVELAGEYNLMVNLAAPGGKYMQAYGKAQLEVGVGVITAHVDRFSLTHVAADGPYKMSARLFRKEENGQAFASLLEDAGETRAYKQASFDRGPIYFLGTTSATPESASGKAPFGRLRVSLDVFTPGGPCSWYGALRFERTQTEFLNNYGTLPKGPGQITLVFDGYKISDVADGKPLVVSEVGLNCARLGAYPEKPIALPLFPAGTFVKAAPGFDLHLLQKDFLLQRGKTATIYVDVLTQGGFNEDLDASIEGLPDGIVAQNWQPRVPARQLGGIVVRLAADADAPLGHYPVTVRAKSKTLERTQSFTIDLDR